MGTGTDNWPRRLAEAAARDTKESKTMSGNAIPADYTADTDRVPVGLSGTHRDRYLDLDRDQRLVYRYHYDVWGRLASHCHKLAMGEPL